MWTFKFFFSKLGYFSVSKLFFTLKKCTGSGASVSDPLTSHIVSIPASVDNSLTSFSARLFYPEAFLSWGFSHATEMETLWAELHELLLTKADPAVATSEYQEQKQRLRPHILKRQTTCGKWITLDPFYPRRRSVCPFWNWHTYSGYGFVFITWSAAASTTFWRLRNCRFADMGSRMSQTREPFYGKKVVRMGSWLGDPLILPYNTSPWSSKPE